MLTKKQLFKLQKRAIRNGLRGSIIETHRRRKHEWKMRTCKICGTLPTGPFCSGSEVCQLCPMYVLTYIQIPCKAFARRYTVTAEYPTPEENALNNGLIASFLYSMLHYLLETGEPILMKRVAKRWFNQVVK